jgi:hypothetical protein
MPGLPGWLAALGVIVFTGIRVGILAPPVKLGFGIVFGIPGCCVRFIGKN